MNSVLFVRDVFFLVFAILDEHSASLLIKNHYIRDAFGCTVYPWVSASSVGARVRSVCKAWHHLEYTYRLVKYEAIKAMGIRSAVPIDLDDMDIENWKYNYPIRPSIVEIEDFDDYDMDISMVEEPYLLLDSCRALHGPPTPNASDKENDDPYDDW